MGRGGIRSPEHLAKLLAGSKARARPVLDRWFDKVPDLGPDVCWPFKGPPTNKGYCHFHLSGDPKRGDRIRILAHRFAWILANGKDIPDGLVVDHICKNTVCVNPAHLRVVTQEDNCTVLARPTPFHTNRTKTHCSKGHEFSPENTAMIPPRGQPDSPKRTRICLTCYPGNWRFALVPRNRPAKALTPEQYERRFGRRDPSLCVSRT
jgi:hypothetical protein